MAMKLVEKLKNTKLAKTFSNIILINKETKLLFIKKIIKYFFSIFSFLLYLKEIFELFGIDLFSFNKSYVKLSAIFFIVLIISIIKSYFDFRKFYKKKYKIDKEKCIEIRVGNYIENAKQLIEEDKRNNLENKSFFIFGTNDGFRFDIVLNGSLQSHFVNNFLKFNKEVYQSNVYESLEASGIKSIGQRTYNNNEYSVYDFGTICEIKFPLTELQPEDRFSLLLFVDSKINHTNNIVGDRCTFDNIKNIWKYMKDNGYTNRRILIPLLGTGCSHSLTYRESITAIIDAFFDDINNNPVPSFKEIIISIHPDRVGNDINLLEIERYIQFKKS